MIELGNIAVELRQAGTRGAIITQAQKKNYAEILSRRLALRIANGLRPYLPGILPNEDGSAQESPARSSRGLKRLDVNYSTVELGLGLSVSIKTINFRDAKTQRYTKNYTRADGELRAEASDYHERQPWAVMVALIFIPIDACDDGKSAPSSFGQAVQVYRFRSGRKSASDMTMLFEKVYIGLYEAAENEHFGEVVFFDVMDAPPRNGRPPKSIKFDDLLRKILDAYDQRNNPRFEWADAPPENVKLPPPDDEDLA